MRKQKEINSLKIANTVFDRRRKLSPEQVKEMVYMYRNRKSLGLKTEEIAAKFSIYPGNITRYTNYDAFLIRANRHSKTYQSKLSREELSDKRRTTQISHREYKSELLDVREKFM